MNESRFLNVMYSPKASPFTIFSEENFNMSPILQTLKTSGSCFWCREMNFISIFDSFRASRVRPSHLMLLFSIYLDSLSLYAKHFQSHNFSENIENTSKFHENPPIRRYLKVGKRRKIMSAAENYCDYANSFSFSLTSFGICFLSTPHFSWDLYSLPKNNFISEHRTLGKQLAIFQEND